MRLYRTLGTLVVVGLLWGSGLVLAQDPVPPLPLTNTLEVAKTEWLLGEPVQLIQTRCNESSAELVLEYPIQCPIESADIRIRDADDELIAFRFPHGPPPFCAPETWQPGECRTSTLAWPQTSGDFFDSAQGPQVAAGIYRAEIGSGTGSVAEFSILLAARSVPSLTGPFVALLALLLTILAGVQIRQRYHY